MELQDTTRGIRTSVYVYGILSVHRFKFRLGAKNPALVGFLHLSPMTGPDNNPTAIGSEYFRQLEFRDV